jgi:hypothetical protein
MPAFGRIFSFVTTGLDPVVHAEGQLARAPPPANDILPQIAPSRIHRANQIDFPPARPVFDVFLALDRGDGSRVLLVIDQHLHSIRVCEALHRSFTIFVNAPNEIAGHTNIKRSARTARQYVNPVPSHVGGSGWIAGSSPAMTNERARHVPEAPRKSRRA